MLKKMPKRTEALILAAGGLLMIVIGLGVWGYFSGNLKSFAIIQGGGGKLEVFVTQRETCNYKQSSVSLKPSSGAGPTYQATPRPYSLVYPDEGKAVIGGIKLNVNYNLGATQPCGTYAAQGTCGGKGQDVYFSSATTQRASFDLVPKTGRVFVNIVGRYVTTSGYVEKPLGGAMLKYTDSNGDTHDIGGPTHLPQFDLQKLPVGSLDLYAHNKKNCTDTHAIPSPTVLGCQTNNFTVTMACTGPPGS